MRLPWLMLAIPVATKTMASLAKKVASAKHSSGYLYSTGAHVRTNKHTNIKQGAHKHEPTVWPLLHACAQPYHPLAVAATDSCFAFVRAHQHIAVWPMNGQGRVSKALYCLRCARCRIICAIAKLLQDFHVLKIPWGYRFLFNLIGEL